MQIKTIMRYHYILITMGIIKKKKESTSRSSLVAQNPSASVGDMGSIPDGQRFHVPGSS